MNDLQSMRHLRAQARQKVANQELPSPEQHSGWARAGSGRKCCLCDAEIPKYRAEKIIAEYVIEWQRSGRHELSSFHSSCFRAWISVSVLPGHASVTG